ncbi:MAG: B12-binding domain-containing radical SAM protein [Holophaga sp.]|nr:B12-binding domain-containing radical SAM protein [Holophaga sp.]
MGRRVLLVYPEMPPTYWSMKYALPFIHRRATFPPLGLLTVAAMLPADFDLTLVDLNVESLTDQQLSRADLVFSSSMLIQKESLQSLIRRCQAQGVTHVAGGPYPTACFATIDGVDHFVLNEAEITLPAFLEDLDRGKAARVYTDTSKPPLAMTPAPRFDLMRPSRYASMALQFSRGCPHHCEFCDIVELFGHKPRTKAPAQFLAELERLYLQGERGQLFVVDDNFIGNRSEVKALLPQLAEWQRARHFPFGLFSETTLTLAEDHDLMAGMVEAGFNMVFLGLETPDRATLAATGKSQNLKSDMLEGVRRIQAHGMEVSAGFILGFDTDPEDIFERQVQFIQEAAIPTAMVGLLTALPNTQLARRLEREGRLIGESEGGNTHDLRINFQPRMNKERLLEGYKRVLAEVYSPNRYFARCLALLKAMKTHPASFRTFDLGESRALFRSFLVQGFSRYSWSYWKFLWKGLWANPRRIADLITMAVKGHHYFQMTRHMLEVDRFKLRLEDLTLAFEDRVRAFAVVGSGERAAELLRFRDRATDRMRKGYRGIHRDFRIYAEQAMDRLAARMEHVLAHPTV